MNDQLVLRQPQFLESCRQAALFWAGGHDSVYFLGDCIGRLEVERSVPQRDSKISL